MKINLWVFILIIMISIIVGGLIGYVIFSNNNANSINNVVNNIPKTTNDANLSEKQNTINIETKDIESKTISNTTETNRIDSNSENLSLNDMVKNAIIDYFENDNTLDDYKILEMRVLNNEDFQELGITLNENEVMAEMRFSVKPKPQYKNYWNAGNGKTDGDWEVEKFWFVSLEKNNGSYKVIGTGTGP